MSILDATDDAYDRKKNITLKDHAPSRHSADIPGSEEARARRRFRWTPELDAMLQNLEAGPLSLVEAFDKIRKLRPDWPNDVISKRARRFGLYRRRPHRK